MPLYRNIYILFSVLILAYLLYFFYFLHQANSQNHDLPVTERSLIAIYTGGHNRIDVGLNLAKQRPQDMVLISGVGAAATFNSILRHNNIDQNGIKSLEIIISDDAKNTYDNTVETDICASLQGVDTVILVTSNYHMPRALKLFNAISDLKVYPYTENSKDLSFKGLLSNSKTFKMVAREYHKYVAFSLHHLLHHYFKLLGVAQSDDYQNFNY